MLHYFYKQNKQNKQNSTGLSKITFENNHSSESAEIKIEDF
jgi:hypothetical protein